jgi:gamma-glutamylcyclotransferase (GGCT)/AIG2-like uncharacterized protein YtfP
MLFISIEKGKKISTPYFLVYGTLRPRMGNWGWSFSKYGSKHLGCTALPGFCKNGGISCEYTGDKEFATVMDLFKVPDEYLKEANEDIDSLEGCSSDNPEFWGYIPAVVTIELDSGEQVQAKFYEAPHGSREYKLSDYVLQSSWTGCKTVQEALERYEALNYNAEYYKNLVNTKKNEPVQS